MKRGPVLLAAVVVVAAGGLGYVLGRSHPRHGMAATGPAAAPASSRQAYTCSMHPQVRLDRPGNCPICAMPLIVADAAQTGSAGEPMLQFSDHALAMASVETTPVTRREHSRELRAVGKVQYNESSLATVTARVDGYAERLFVNFTGVEIKAGDHLAEVYSPELLVAQQELLIALRGGTDRQVGPMVETAKLKLKRWGLTDEQILALVEDNKISDRVTLYSPIQGTVIEKAIVQNSAFKAGDALYRVANLDTVWVYLDIYEYDLVWVRYGQRVELAAEALPGRAFDGMVTFVQPIVNEETRTVRVPVHVKNADHALKPGMFTSAVIQSALAGDGRAAPTGVEGRFTCPMHPEVLRDASGHCPICEMQLEQIVGPKSDVAAHPATGLLVVPVTAVLDSGTRQIVYVEKSRGLFEPREVVLGPRSGGFVPVLKGVVDGERVVTRGGFLIDSQFQITGHPSLFYPGGLMGGSAGHDHGAAPPKPDGDATQHKH